MPKEIEINSDAIPFDIVDDSTITVDKLTIDFFYCESGNTGITVSYLDANGRERCHDIFVDTAHGDISVIK